MALSVSLRIARKEFLENVLSWKFVIALVFSTLLLSTSVIVLGSGYKEDYKTYSVRMAEMEEQAEQDPYSRVWFEVQRVLMHPNVLAVFVGGPGDDARRDDNGGAGPGATPSGNGSPTNLRFDPLDLGFVAVVVMTFMAVVFSYDSVTGEKERGTLKLMLANPVPKDAVILGKYLGGMASILVPFGLSLVISLAVLSGTGVSLGAEEWARLGMVLGLFVLLVSAFFLVGLLVSSLVKRSGTSLLAMTLVWLVLVFGVGNVAAVVAKETTPTMSQTDIQEQFRILDEETMNRAQEFEAEARLLYDKMWQNNGTLSPEDQARLEAIQKEQETIWKEASEKREGILTAARRQLDNQLTRAESIAAVSPAESFRSLATALARSDYWTLKEQSEAAEEYQREVERLRREWEQDNPGGYPGEPEPRPLPMPGGPASTGSDVIVIDPIEPGGNGFVPPPFRYEASSVEEEVSSPSGLRDLLVLIGYNVVAFLGAYVAFLRYDVR